MAELSTLTAADRRAVLSPGAIAVRRQIAPIVLLALPQIAGARQVLPSYVVDAVDKLMTAVRQWEHDEHEALADARS